MKNPSAYRLRGDVGGVTRSYRVDRGEALLGSLGANEIVLPVRGVSRRHARLTLGEDGLVLEDLESRNGVLVNGVRVQRTLLRAGDEVRLGPVCLRVEEVPAEDVQIAIAIDPASKPEGLPSWQTTTASDAGPRGEPPFGLLGGFVERLCVVPEADVSGAIELLRNESRARGVCLFECGGRGHEPVILSSAGDLDFNDVARRVQDALRGLEKSIAGAVSSAISTEAGEAVTSAVLQRPGHETLGLVCWGPPLGETLPGLLVRLLDRLRPKTARLVQEGVPVKPTGLVFPADYVPGGSTAMASLYGQMRSLLHGNVPVLILGETGVGKEPIARILHASSPRGKGPFVAVNCAAIPAELLEAEMFGIGKGVATGVVDRPGKFQLAEGGMLFLDEIGDMPLELQAKLLRALQEKEVQPVGGPLVPVNIRVVAATNADLMKRMEAGRFRRDLYYRLAGHVLEVPPLRGRREDVPALVEAMVRRFAREAGRSVRGVTAGALRALVEQDWPGNIRELEHVLRRLVQLCPDGDAIDSGLVPLQALPASPAPALSLEGTSLDLASRLQVLEELLVREALARAGGNRTQAAKLLGISRNGLAIKMQRLGIGA